MSKTVARVIIPTNPAEVLDLAKKVSDKHIADAASSPLNALVDNKWSLTPVSYTHLDVYKRQNMLRSNFERCLGRVFISLKGSPRQILTILKPIESSCSAAVLYENNSL